MSGPLDGIKVFDLTVVGVGPFATMLLANMGANVVKVEQGPMWPPAYQGSPPYYNGLSVVYMTCHNGKRCIYLDLKSHEGKEAALRLLKEADVFAENMSYGTVQRLGLGYEDISKISPDIIYGNFPGWGAEGPYNDRGSADPTGQVFSGSASINGSKNGDPEIIRWPGLHDFNASNFITLVLLLGLLHRQRSGNGLRVLNPQVGASVYIQTSRIAEFLATGEVLPRMGSATTNTVPHRAFLCQDKKWLAVGVIADPQWRRLCNAIGAEDLLGDGRFAENSGRVKHRDELEDKLGKIFGTKPMKWWEIQLRKHKVPVSQFYDYTQVLDIPQVKANNLFVRFKYPLKDSTAKAIDYPTVGKYGETGTLPFGNIPFQFSKTPIKLTPGMLPGAHTQSILEEGWGDSGSNGHAKGYYGPSGAIETGVLDGVTVVDMTQGISGPYASLLLADNGARVIKVEPIEGDYTRGWEPKMNGVGATFFHLNRNKEGLRLDIRKVQDRKRLIELLKGADIFIEEEGQARLRRLGLGQKELEKINPRLITCTITPFGEKGPWRNQPASELVLQAMSDYLNNLGVPGEEPVRIGADMASAGTSLYAVHAILGALYHQWRTGEGQHISLNQMATLLFMRSFQWTGLVDPDGWAGFLSGYTKPPEHPYKAKDQPLLLGAIRDASRMPELLTALGMDKYIDDPLFKNPPGMIMGFGSGGNIDLGDLPYRARPIWEEGFKKFTADELTSLLLQFGSTSTICNNHKQLYGHTQTKAMELFTEVDGVRYLCPPWKLYGVPRNSPRPYVETK